MGQPLETATADSAAAKRGRCAAIRLEARRGVLCRREVLARVFTEAAAGLPATPIDGHPALLARLVTPTVSTEPARTDREWEIAICAESVEVDVGICTCDQGAGPDLTLATLVAEHCGRRRLGLTGLERSAGLPRAH